MKLYEYRKAVDLEEVIKLLDDNQHWIVVSIIREPPGELFKYTIVFYVFSE